MKSSASKTWLVMAVAMSLVVVAHAAPDNRAAIQAAVESGQDLGSRARQVLFRARTMRMDGDAGGAASALDKWLNGHSDRDHCLLCFERALSRQILDQPDSALADLQRAVALEPRFARAWLKLGEIAYNLERYDLAAEGFGRGYALTPDRQPEILHYQGVCLLLAGQPEQAANVLIELLTEYRTDAGLEWYRALISAEQSCAEPGDAAPLLDHLVQDFASDPKAWDLAAQYLVARQNYRRAAVCLTIADYLEPLDTGRLSQLAELYAACGVPLQAARYYERVMALRPQVASTDSLAVEGWRQDQERLASAWLAAHRFQRAQKVLQAAVAIDPDFGRGYLLLGYTAVELGQDEQAKRYLARASHYPKQALEASRIQKSLISEE